MACSDGLAYRSLNEGDIAPAVALSAEAGWNQTADDWRFLLHGARTFGVEAPDGKLIATALAHFYPDRVAWIAMVLVTAEWRQKGIATGLMRRCVAYCRAEGLVAGLAATPAGRKVYLPLGFRDVYRFTRLERPAGMPSLPGREARRVEACDLDRVADYDRAVSGMDRGALIRDLWQRPGQSFLVEREGRLCGVALVRDGRCADQVGPLLADDPAIGLDLARASLYDISNPVFVDVLDDKPEIRSFFEAVGFREQRGYTRMLLERSEPLDSRDKVFLVAGPELG